MHLLDEKLDGTVYSEPRIFDMFRGFFSFAFAKSSKGQEIVRPRRKFMKAYCRCTNI